jgi:hypothetical protein
MALASGLAVSRSNTNTDPSGHGVLAFNAASAFWFA